MKKQKVQKPSHRVGWHKICIALVSLLIISAVAVQIAYNKIIWQTMSRQSNSELRTMITDGIRDTSKDAVIDGPSRKVYLPEPQLVLPPYPNDVEDLRYSYTSAQEAKADSELRITTKRTLNSGIAGISTAGKIEDIFEGVSRAQSCSRQIVVTFQDIYGQEGGDHTKVAVVKLEDGRTAFLYLDNACTENSEELIRYLQLIQSY